MTKEGNKRRGKGFRGLVSVILSLLLLLQGFMGSTPVYADPPSAVPQVPTAAAGEEYIDVTGVEPGATLKLYTTDGQLASTTYRDMGNGTYRFEDVLPHSSGYYVTQSVGGQESSNSQFVNPSFRIPVATKGVESVDVTNVSSNATIRLYKVVEGTDPDILISANPTSVGNGTYRFENITPDSAGFYVTQYANTIESANCPFFGVDLRTPSISGGNGGITVSNIFPGATLTLYDSDGDPIQTASNVTEATHQFDNVDLGSGYYVQQMINGVISLPSNVETVYSSGPQFVGGTPSIAVRQYPNPTDLRDQLYVSDLDVGQTLTWTVVSGPSHGTLDGFPATASTNGSGGIYGTVGSTDTRIPTAVTYTPAQGYTGSDSFTIQVSDGTATATRTINVGVNHTSGTSVNAMNSAELTAAINNPAVATIILMSNTNYQIGGAEINRPLTIRGNGATIEVLSGVGQSFDAQTIYHLGMPDKDGNRRYRGNIFWYVKDGGSLTVENLTLRNTATTENAQGLTGVFAAILLNDDADLDVSGVVFDNFWFKNSKLAEQNNLLAAQGLGGYTTYSDLSYGVYGDYNCTGNITIDHSIFSSSNAFRDAVHIYNANNVTLDYNTFTGTNYPDRLRESDAFEYGMYLYGGNYTVTHNTVRYYDSYKIPGYSSAGIALLPYNDTDATLEDNTIQGNTVGLEIVGGWEALNPAPNVTINEIELDTEDNGFKIGEALKASNTISGSTGADIFIKLDQDDADEAFVYYAPFLSISGTNTTEPTLNFAQTAGAIELVSSAITIEVEKSEDNGLSWTTASVEGTLDNSSTSAVVNLEANKTYTLRVKMTHNNGQTPNAVITGYSNAVTFTTASGISLVTAPEFTFTAATEGYGPQPFYSVTVMNTGAEGTGALAIILSGENPGSFELSKNSIADIGAGSNDIFTVRPTTGLAAGTYTATVTVSGVNVTAQSFNVSFTVSPAETTFTATIYHDIDNLAADVTGSVELKQGTTTITASKSETGIGIYTASVPNGYYSIYVNGVDTGRMLIISAGNNTATLRYYTVSFSATFSGTATGSSINATAGGTAISSGAVVLAGTSVAITASGTGAGSYTYAWSGLGTSGQTTGTLNIPSLNSTVNATCTVTGSGSPSADPDYRINNESYNWSGSDQTIVLAGNSDTLTIFKAPTAVVKIDVQSDDGSNVTIDGNSILYQHICGCVQRYHAEPA
nr:pectate lyase-like adhesive domain-containing protein [Desulfitobacterium hafniense]